MKDENDSIDSALQVHRLVLSKFKLTGIRKRLVLSKFEVTEIRRRDEKTFILHPSSFLSVRAGTGECKHPRNAARFRQFH